MQMMRELIRQLEECDKDSDVRAIIITGTQGLFSVGADIHELAGIQTYGQVQLPDLASKDVRQGCTFQGTVCCFLAIIPNKRSLQTSVCWREFTNVEQMTPAETLRCSAVHPELCHACTRPRST